MTRSAFLNMADRAVDRCDLASARFYERLAMSRPGDVVEGAGGWFVVVDVVAGEADGPMSRAEAQEHGDSFGDEP